eukprot:663649-Pelagomonas_calceolata.AAC.3
MSCRSGCLYLTLAPCQHPRVLTWLTSKPFPLPWFTDEAEEYYKTSVQALVQGELVPADVYVFKDEYSPTQLDFNSAAHPAVPSMLVVCLRTAHASRLTHWSKSCACCAQKAAVARRVGLRGVEGAASGQVAQSMTQLEMGSGDWDYEHFLNHELEPYLAMTKEFMAEEFGDR